MAKKTARKKSPAKAKKAAKKPAKKAARKAARRPARAAASAAPDAGYSPPRLVGPSVVHWEVQARDPVAQREFFGSLFGWNVDANNPQNYGVVSPGGPGSIGGGIGSRRTRRARRSTCRSPASSTRWTGRRRWARRWSCPGPTSAWS